MKKLTLEINPKHIKSNDTFKIGNGVVMVTPDINEEYFVYRVKVHKEQAILGFSKFGLIGIGFAKEEDWNTNLPSGENAEYIYNHIKCNKKYESITKETCIEAIKMIQEAVNNNKK